MLCAICAGLLSCKKETPSTELVTFPLKGEVIAIDTARLRITIAHEEIPDYMAAMVMPFKVRDRELFEGFEPGDSVQATLAVSRTESWLATLSLLRRGEAPEELTTGNIQLKRLYKTGDTLPDLRLLNQDGAPVYFSSFRGKAVAVTFIYTRCPLPEFCIRMSDYFAKIQKALTSDSRLSGRWHLVTVSFDPRFDTPRVLKEYGMNYGADFLTWDFVTDPDSTGRSVRRLADGLDLTYENDEGLIAHNLRTVLLDRQGRIVEVIKDNEWKPQEIVEKIRSIVKD